MGALNREKSEAGRQVGLKYCLLRIDRPPVWPPLAGGGGGALLGTRAKDFV